MIATLYVKDDSGYREATSGEVVGHDAVVPIIEALASRARLIESVGARLAEIEGLLQRRVALLTEGARSDDIKRQAIFAAGELLRLQERISDLGRDIEAKDRRISEITAELNAARDYEREIMQAAEMVCIALPAGPGDLGGTIQGRAMHAAQRIENLERELAERGRS